MSLQAHRLDTLDHMHHLVFSGLVFQNQNHGRSIQLWGEHALPNRPPFVGGAVKWPQGGQNHLADGGRLATIAKYLASVARTESTASGPHPGRGCRLVAAARPGGTGNDPNTWRKWPAGQAR